MSIVKLFLCQSIKASLVLSGRELHLKLGKRPEYCLPFNSNREGTLLSRGVVMYSSNANLQDSLGSLHQVLDSANGMFCSVGTVVICTGIRQIYVKYFSIVSK